MLDEVAKIRPLTNRFQTYLKEALHLDAKVSNWPGEKALPLYLRQFYAFCQTRLLGTDTLLLIPKEDVAPTPATMVKHLRGVSEKWPHDLVVVTGAVSSLTRKRMIEQKISFVVPGNQIYLPKLGMDLREHFRRLQMAKPAFSPSTQVLVLDALYHPRRDPDTPTQSAKRLGYTVMTMTRVFDELEQAGLGEHSVMGKERRLVFPQNLRELWEAALPFLKKPVNKFRYTASKLTPGTRYKAGLTALAEYSNLAPPETEVIAVDAEGYRAILKLAVMEANPPCPGSKCIELWSYPPERFGKHGIADPLSVFLSLRHEDDERVQMALAELLRGMKW